MKITLALFRTIGERIMVIALVALSWTMGLKVGLHGIVDILNPPTPELHKFSTLLLLYGVIEFILSATFFISLRRQILPGGTKELVDEPLTFSNKAQYFSRCFALGMFAGLACHAVVVLIVVTFF